MLWSPLEQFSLNVLKPSLIPVDSSLLFNLVRSGFIRAPILYVSLYGVRLIPRGWQWLREHLRGFYVGVAKQQAGIRGEFLAPFLGSFFIYILTANLIGLVPFSFAVTAQLAVTLSMALTVNIGFFILGFYKNKITFLKLFVPSGVPIGVLPLIVVIEVVSYLLRTFSLSVRLFANIMAGHTLLHILASFVVRFLTNESYVLATVPGALVLAVTALEFAIAFLQAYVFLVLCSIYYNDALHPRH